MQGWRLEGGRGQAECGKLEGPPTHPTPLQNLQKNILFDWFLKRDRNEHLCSEKGFPQNRMLTSMIQD